MLASAVNMIDYCCMQVHQELLDNLVLSEQDHRERLEAEAAERQRISLREYHTQQITRLGDLALRVGKLVDSSPSKVPRSQQQLHFESLYANFANEDETNALIQVKLVAIARLEPAWCGILSRRIPIRSDLKMRLYNPATTVGSIDRSIYWASEDRLFYLSPTGDATEEIRPGSDQVPILSGWLDRLEALEFNIPA